MYKYLLFLSFVFIVPRCSTDRSEGLSDMEYEEITPSALLTIDHIDTVYFQHVGYSSVVLNNGEIVIPDRDDSKLVVIDSDGGLQKIIRGGKGPGEVLDAYEFTRNKNGGFQVEDQENGKIIFFDSSANLVKELVTPAFEGSSLQKVYPVTDSTYIFQYTSHAYLFDESKNPELTLIAFNEQTEQFEKRILVSDKPYARFYLDGQLRGASVVPYSYSSLVAHIPENESLLIFDTSTASIVELDNDFDTLRTIPVELPVEEIESSELDSATVRVRNIQHRNLIKSMLPDVKAPADEMKYYKNRIWLKTNLRGNSDIWLVLNMEGDILKKVYLPKESMLMHVHEEHLGIRLDANTFALFEPVN